MPLKRFYCNMPDCGKLLFEGEIRDGVIEKVCPRCKVMNKFEFKPEDKKETNGKPFQDRLGLVKKSKYFL